MGWVRFMHSFCFLFIFLDSLLMCLTEGQTLINRGVGQLVTWFFIAIPLRLFLCLFSTYSPVLWFLFFSLFSSLRPVELEFLLWKETEVHQQGLHQLTYYSRPTVHASAVSQEKSLPAVSTVYIYSSVNEINIYIHIYTHDVGCATPAARRTCFLVFAVVCGCTFRSKKEKAFNMC